MTVDELINKLVRLQSAGVGKFPVTLQIQVEYYYEERLVTVEIDKDFLDNEVVMLTN